MIGNYFIQPLKITCMVKSIWEKKKTYQDSMYQETHSFPRRSKCSKRYGSVIKAIFYNPTACKTFSEMHKIMFFLL